MNSRHFSGRLSPGVLSELDRLASSRTEVLDFVERMLRIYAAAEIDATDVSIASARHWSGIAPHVLPGAWDGVVPSITFPNRHVRIDEYFSRNTRHKVGLATTFVDLGCGFPPLTTLDTAERFPEWSIIGMDRMHWPYLVIDRHGDRAVFDETGVIKYFQPKMSSSADWRRILQDKDATKARFSRLLEEMLRLTNDLGSALASFDHEGARLVQNPVLEYERHNLRFTKGDLADLDFHDIDFARCFNVLMYFDHAFRLRVLASVGSILKPGGLFVTGFDWAETLFARYLVYQSEGGRLVPKEFAFTLDNVRSSGTGYFTLHDDDAEVRQLVDAVAALRRAPNFMADFSTRFDALHEQYSVCPRGPDGYLGDMEDMAGHELAQRSLAMLDTLAKEGYTERAVESLRAAGFDAWQNEVGHVAFTPR
jgi:SAM-dependent methyltransferase